MASKQELLEVTNTMIQKLHDDINLLQDQALKQSAAGDYENLHVTLTKQREAIAARIAMVEAAQYLQKN